MIVHGHGSQVMTASYIPWVIWALIKLKQESNIRCISILALIIGLQLQRAHVQIAYYSWMTAGLLIIMLLFKIHDKSSKNKNNETNKNH